MYLLGGVDWQLHPFHNDAIATEYVDQIILPHKDKKSVSVMEMVSSGYMDINPYDNANHYRLTEKFVNEVMI